MKTIKPISDNDSLLLSYAQFYQMGLVNKKSYKQAIRKIRKEREEAFVNEHFDARWNI